MSDKKMREVRPNPPSIVFRQAPNLRQRLVKSAFKTLPYQNGEYVENIRPGSYKFNHPARGRPCAT